MHPSPTSQKGCVYQIHNLPRFHLVMFRLLTCGACRVYRLGGKKDEPLCKGLQGSRVAPLIMERALKSRDSLLNLDEFSV